ncbi:MAG: diguanylate cyclase domain-containing protein [Capsulimonadaceae bacterium]
MQDTTRCRPDEDSEPSNAVDNPDGTPIHNDVEAADHMTAELEVRSVIASARCIVWHAAVDDYDGHLVWDFRLTDEAAARRWLPLRIADDEPFIVAFTQAIHPDDQVAMDTRASVKLHSEANSYSQEYRCMLADGEYRWIAEDVHIDRVGPRKWRLVGVCTDVTEQKLSKERLANERNLLRTLIDNLPDSICVKDTQGHYLVYNSAHARMLGVDSPEQLMGKTDFDFLPDDKATEYFLDELAIIQSGKPLIDKEEPIVLPNGHSIWQSITKVPLTDRATNVIGIIGIRRDITLQKIVKAEQERRLLAALERANRDPLTGLWNHRFFQTRLTEEAENALSRETSLAVILLDLDNFRFFNDMYGVSVGDAVLCKVARALANACRPEDTLARFGGDEFAVIAPLLDVRRAEEIATHLAASVNAVSHRPPDAKHSVPVHLSWGMAVFPNEAPSRLDVLTLADNRLMLSKAGSGEAGILAERLVSRLTTTRDGFKMLSALVNSVDNKDRYTRRHSEDVLLYAMQIARQINLDQTTMDHLQVSALLHDVGKIGVPDTTLRKPGKLTAEEYEAIKLHPTMGAVIVGAIAGFEAALPAVRHHHERWDGAGYPDGLARDDIPLLARILAVADAFSAMTTDRPYRKSMSSDTAETILCDGAGSQWDSALVHAFIAARRENA